MDRKIDTMKGLTLSIPRSARGLEDIQIRLFEAKRFPTDTYTVSESIPDISPYTHTKSRPISSKKIESKSVSSIKLEVPHKSEFYSTLIHLNEGSGRQISKDSTHKADKSPAKLLNLSRTAGGTSVSSLRSLSSSSSTLPLSIKPRLDAKDLLMKQAEELRSTKESEQAPDSPINLLRLTARKQSRKGCMRSSLRRIPSTPRLNKTVRFCV